MNITFFQLLKTSIHIFIHMKLLLIYLLLHDFLFSHRFNCNLLLIWKQKKYRKILLQDVTVYHHCLFVCLPLGFSWGQMTWSYNDRNNFDSSLNFDFTWSTKLIKLAQQSHSFNFVNCGNGLLNIMYISIIEKLFKQKGGVLNNWMSHKASMSSLRIFGHFCSISNRPNRGSSFWSF